MHVFSVIVLLIIVLSIFGGGCHTIPDPNDPARQARIDDCLARCASTADVPPSNTAYAADPVKQADTRTPCERRCHSIP